MRDNSLSHQPTSFWPMKLAASRPVRKIISSVNTAPAPGMAKPTSDWGCIDSGSKRSDWSSVLTMSDSTQPVMTSGTQINRPVMK